MPRREKTLGETKQNRPKINASGRGMQRLPYTAWLLLAHALIQGHLGLTRSFPSWILSSPAAPDCVIQVPTCHGDSVLVLAKGQPLTFGLGVVPVLQSRVCTVILHMSSCTLPHCNGTFPRGLTHGSPWAFCRLLAELRAPWQDADSKWEGVVERLERPKEPSMAS